MGRKALQDASHTSGPPEMAPRLCAAQDVTASFPMTPMQTGLLYESTLAGAPWINFEQILCRMTDEPFDLRAMRAAWQALAARHEVLRTVFRWQGCERPMQDVLAKPAVDLTVLDLSHKPPPAQEQALSDWLEQDRQRGFEVSLAPGWRLCWFKLGARKSVLVWSFHHALLDGRGWIVPLKEVLDDYTARATGQPALEFPPAPVSFGRYCTALDRLDPTGAKEHFKAKLAEFDAPNIIDLAPPPPTKTQRKQLVERRLPVEVGDALSHKARASDTSVATLVVAAWGLVVARCSNRADAVIGVVRAGRYVIPDTVDTAGCLINTLPARLHTAPDMTIDALLKALRHDQQALRPFEHCALTDVGQWSDLPTGTALFESDVMFDHATLDARMKAFGGIWETRHFELLEEGALPLSLAVYQDPEVLCRLEYDPSRYSEQTALRLLGYLTTLLQNLAALPGTTPLSDVQMLGTSEQQQVLTLAQPDNTLPPQPCVIDRFEHCVQTRGDAVALSQIGLPDRLTYAALDQHANRLAHLLRSRSIGPGDLVALCLPRSADYVIAMLAVMKSGAAFLPLDPSYPSAAISHMLTDSDAALVLTNGSNPPVGTAAPTLLLDRAELASQPDTAPPRNEFDPQRTAYVIYTSGSIGPPKGVPISVQALSQHTAAIRRAFALTPDDRALQFASLSFDVSIEEILPTLLSGAQLVLRDDLTADSIAAFLHACQERHITVLNLPTAFWHILVDQLEHSGTRLPDTLRLLVIGGEAISRSVLSRFRAIAPELRCVNGYGTTEATITSTLYDLAQADALPADQDVPIGRPLSHARSFVLSPDGALAPQGAAGALWLGGDALSPGYLNRPALNDSSFCTGPDGARIYNSGDVVRWREDGHLAFAGRQDRQVKVNGFRIELREVERALEEIEGVGLALAALREAGTPRAQLAAWVTPASPDSPLTVNALRKAIAQRLPAHKVPVISILPRFPKTPGGKVDLAALPAPAALPRATSRVEQKPPHDPVIAYLCQSFAELLDLGHVGPDESFFDLGGHSLLAVRLIGRIETRYDHRLSIAVLHSDPTPRALARLIATGTGTVPVQNTYVVEIQPKGSLPPLFGVHVLGPKEMFFRPLAKALGPDQPLLGLTVGLLTKDSPTSVYDTAALYLKQLEQRCPTGPIALAAVSQGSYVAFELAQQLRNAGREVSLLALFDGSGPAGRDRLRGLPWLRMHLCLLRTTGVGYLGSRIKDRIEALRELHEKRRVRKVGLGQTTPSISQFVAANTLAIEEYDAQPYAGALTVFRAKGSVFDTSDAIANGLGWRPVAAGPFALEEVPGGHITMLEPPNVAILAKRLRHSIDNASRAEQGEPASLTSGL